MSTNDKTRDKLMSSMHKTKEGISDVVAEAEASDLIDSKPQTSKQTVEKSTEKNREKQIDETKKDVKKDLNRAEYFRSKRVWPD